jgi:hypothetical protein
MSSVTRLVPLRELKEWPSACPIDTDTACNRQTQPQLVIQTGNLPATAVELRDLLAASGRLFDRGVPVRVIPPADGGSPAATPLTRNHVVMEAHRLCQPVKMKDGELFAVTLSDRLAQMYLDMTGEWLLPPLAGVSTAPVLSGDGGVRQADGYDATTSLWCSGVPQLDIPARPSRAEAEAALKLLREAFRTFPFADAARRRDPILGVEVVDITKAPGLDESVFLVSLLTAVCRPSLWLAPGLLVTAPAVSGAGSGKGLLVRGICAIAFGTPLRAFTMGGERQELDKRLAAELIEAQPALFLDNANSVALRSDTLASVLTERPARVRLLGQTRMVPLNSTAFVAVTGNGLTVSEDLGRRFLLCELDARCEDPELRPFPSGFLEEVQQRRAKLLAAALTIWRWGRQTKGLIRCKPLGSFETWAEWCRDPLVALGCRDPVERIETLKAGDPYRQRIAELFRTWWEHHGQNPVKANELTDPVKAIADPQERGRQYLATFLTRLAGTHAAGFVLARQEPAGKWSAATYVLSKTMPVDPMGHRTDRTDRFGTAASAPMTPMGPMPDEVEGARRSRADDGDPFASLKDPSLRLKVKQLEPSTAGPSEALDDIKQAVEEDRLDEGLERSWR